MAGWYNFGAARFLGRTYALPPACWGRPGRKGRSSLRILTLIEVHPDSRKIIQISAQAKTGAGALKCLRFCAGAGVLVVSPFFARCGMRSQAGNGQLTRDQNFCYNFLVLAALEIRAGMDGVFSGPACRSEQSIQTIGVGTLIGVRDHLTK